MYVLLLYFILNFFLQHGVILFIYVAVQLRQLVVRSRQLVSLNGPLADFLEKMRIFIFVIHILQKKSKSSMRNMLVCI